MTFLGFWDKWATAATNERRKPFLKILFVHQNFPGQYLHLAPQLATRGHTVLALSKRTGVNLPGVRILNYALSEEPHRGTHPFIARSRRDLDFAIAAAKSAMQLKEEGFEPDLICAHPGWGEALYLRDVWPNTPQLHYCEFFLKPFGPQNIFRPSEPQSLHQIVAARANSHLFLAALDSMDAGISPTAWQRQQYPLLYQHKIETLHDGINCRVCQPNSEACVTLSDGRQLTRSDQVVTYVSRNLEPARGFPEFMRSVEMLLAVNKDVEILIIGGEETSYSPGHSSGKSWRDVLIDEMEIDLSRVHFLGKVPYATYLSVIQVSSAHIYFTVPYVLSWSVLEAMACGSLVIASRTEPVTEVISHGLNGLLCDFFDPSALVDQIHASLKNPRDFDAIRTNARATILDRYSLDRCLPGQIELAENLGTA